MPGAGVLSLSGTNTYGGGTYLVSGSPKVSVVSNLTANPLWVLTGASDCGILKALPKSPRDPERPPLAPVDISRSVGIVRRTKRSELRLSFFLGVCLISAALLF